MATGKEPVRDWLRLIRVKQYVKNGFIFLPAFFAGQLLAPHTMVRLMVAFVSFSLIASAVYIFNDWRDLEADKSHPEKRHRPLASGAIPLRSAVWAIGILAVAGMAGLFFLGKKEAVIGGLYLAINIGYSLGLKKLPLLDLFLVALGFVLRLFIGAYAPLSFVPLSEWIVIMTFLLALFLGFGKRREEVKMAEAGQAVRDSVKGYNLVFVNGAMLVMASVIMVAYLGYTLSPEVQARLHSRQLYLTTIFVALGIFRYLQLTFVDEKSGNPTQIFWEDRFLNIVIAGWVISFFVLLYG
jgi:4-hydroxybenzoate polyprenyltransferase